MPNFRLCGTGYAQAGILACDGYDVYADRIGAGTVFGFRPLGLGLSPSA